MILRAPTRNTRPRACSHLANGVRADTSTCIYIYYVVLCFYFIFIITFFFFLFSPLDQITSFAGILRSLAAHCTKLLRGGRRRPSAVRRRLHHCYTAPLPTGPVLAVIDVILLRPNVRQNFIRRPRSRSSSAAQYTRMWCNYAIADVVGR